MHDQQGTELERCAKVIGLDPAGNDGARLRVVKVGRVDVTWSAPATRGRHEGQPHYAVGHKARHALRHIRLLVAGNMPLACIG